MSFYEYKAAEKEMNPPKVALCGGSTVTADYRSGDEQEMLLIRILHEVLKRLNEGFIVSDDRANQVITRLRMLHDNQEWLSWICGEKSMKFAVDEKERNIRLIDFGEVDPMTTSARTKIGFLELRAMT